MAKRVKLSYDRIESLHIRDCEHKNIEKSSSSSSVSDTQTEEEIDEAFDEDEK